MTLADVRRDLAAGASVHDLIKAITGAIAKSESGAQRLNAFVAFDAAHALLAAADFDARSPDAADLPLLGVPVGIKDNLCTVEYATTCASRILLDFISPYDATVVRRLRAAGAIVVGKTNLDEFAMGSTTETSVFGRTHNPHDFARVTGGSSGGSAAAVAAGLVPVALGSDTAGSVRQPAAFCGVVGFKPTYGRVSRYGLIAYASSLDTVGIFSNTVKDVEEVLEVIAGIDAHDATTADVPLTTPAPPHPKGLVIGVPREYFPPDLDAGVRDRCREAMARLEEAGAEIRAVELPHTRFAIPAYYALSTAEAASNLARYDGVRYGVRARDVDSISELYERTRSLGFGNEVKRRIMLGLHVLGGSGRGLYERAQQACRLITMDFERVFAGGVDFLFTPTTATPAFASGERTDPYELYVSDTLTVGANLSGIPAISVPIGSTNGLPVGGQLLAPRWHDGPLIHCAGLLEELIAE